MPHDTKGLKAYLESAKIELCGGWCSGNSLLNDFSEECAAISQQVDQFVELSSPCIVYSECSNTVQGEIQTPVNKRPKLTRDEISSYALKISEVAKWCADRGMPMAYHHHMGSIIETEDDVNWLMDASSSDLNLCFDTGHLLFGGGDVMATLDRWGDRIHHVHYKDIRPSIVEDVRTVILAILSDDEIEGVGGVW